MKASDAITLWRTLINDPQNTGRWSDTSALTFLTEACQELCRDIEFPQGRLSFYTQPNLQEYTLTTPILRYYRVYVAGQPIVPTSIDTLEGRQYQLFDQGNNGSGVPEAIPVAGSGGPPDNPGVMSPAWTVAAPSLYPVTNVWGLPAPDAQPWQVGQRPRYYTRGLAVIGIVPAPLNVTTVTIDGLFIPDQVTTTTQELPFTYQYKRALAWKMAELASFSDNSDRASDARAYAASQYEKFMREARTDMKRGDRQKRLPKMLTYRSFYQKGNNRGGSQYTEYE